MKRIALWTGVVVLVLVVIVAAVARTEFRGGRNWGGHGWHHSWRHDGPLRHVARELNMSKAQIAETRSIVLEERPAVAALLQELLGEVHQMADATTGKNFDEDKVRSIAATEGNTVAKLLVEKERLKSRIYATVLNETQRKSADDLQQRWLGRLDRVVSRMQKQSQ